MAKDDYFVIVYRLLKYLYDCLKKGKNPNIEVLDASFFSINEQYWEYIIKNMHADGLITGVTIFPVLGKLEGGVKITPKGIQYLDENSMFQKIKEAVKDIADIIPI